MKIYCNYVIVHKLLNCTEPTAQVNCFPFFFLFKLLLIGNNSTNISMNTFLAIRLRLSKSISIILAKVIRYNFEPLVSGHMQQTLYYSWEFCGEIFKNQSLSSRLGEMIDYRNLYVETLAIDRQTRRGGQQHQ